jgi:hypothetical protein
VEIQTKQGRGGARAGAGRKPAMVAQLGAALEDADVHIEAARTLLRRWRAALLAARGPYWGQFAAPAEVPYGAQVRRARRRVAMTAGRVRRAR